MLYSQSWPITKIIFISGDIFSCHYQYESSNVGLFLANDNLWMRIRGRSWCGRFRITNAKMLAHLDSLILTLYCIIYYYSSTALRSETKGSGPCQPDWRGNLPKVRTLELNCYFEYISKSAHVHKSCAEGSLNPLSEWTLSTGQSPFLGMWTFFC